MRESSKYFYPFEIPLTSAGEILLKLRDTEPEKMLPLMRKVKEMDIIEEQVRHSKYGPGVVVGQEDDSITVKFTAENDVKKFLYPSVFESYLKLCSEEMQVKQSEEIARRRAEEDAVQAAKAAEEEKRRNNDKVAEKKVKAKTRSKRHNAAKVE